jgi:hypothetical protein
MSTGMPVSAIFSSFCRTIAIAGLNPKITLSSGSPVPGSGDAMLIAEFMLITKQDHCIQVSIRQP